MVTVGHDQTILHIFRNGYIFLLLLVALLHLFFQGFVLVCDTTQKRHQFIIGDIFQRMIQVDCLQRLHHALCRPVDQIKTQDQQ